MITRTNYKAKRIFTDREYEIGTSIWNIWDYFLNLRATKTFDSIEELKDAMVGRFYPYMHTAEDMDFAEVFNQIEDKEYLLKEINELILVTDFYIDPLFVDIKNWEGGMLTDAELSNCINLDLECTKLLQREKVDNEEAIKTKYHDIFTERKLVFGHTDCFWGPEESIVLTGNIDKIIKDFKYNKLARDMGEMFTSYNYVQIYKGEELVDSFQTMQPLFHTLEDIIDIYKNRKQLNDKGNLPNG